MQSKIVPAVILTLCTVHISGMVIGGAGIESSDCRGELTLIAPCGVRIKYFKNENQIDFNVEKVDIEGCSCFRLYKNQHYRGKSFLVRKGGMKKVPLRRVGSLARVDCPRQSTGGNSTKKNKQLEHKRKTTTYNQSKITQLVKDGQEKELDLSILAAKRQTLNEDISKLKEELAILDKELLSVWGSK